MTKSNVFASEFEKDCLSQDIEIRATRKRQFLEDNLIDYFTELSEEYSLAETANDMVKKELQVKWSSLDLENSINCACDYILRRDVENLIDDFKKSIDDSMIYKYLRDIDAAETKDDLGKIEYEAHDYIDGVCCEIDGEYGEVELGRVMNLAYMYVTDYTLADHVVAHLLSREDIQKLLKQDKEIDEMLKMAKACK